MPDQAEAFVATLAVAKFYGVGPKTTARMSALGIATGADLRRQTLDFLQRNFGKAGSWYYEIARGYDDRPVQPDRERKSSGSETTFSEDLIDPVPIEARVIAMADDVWAWCEKTNARGRTVTVKIKWADFQISTRSRSMEMTVKTREKLHQLALGLIRSVFPLPKGIRLVGVTLSNFQAQSGSDAAELPLSWDAIADYRPDLPFWRVSYNEDSCRIWRHTRPMRPPEKRTRSTLVRLKNLVIYTPSTADTVRQLKLI
jgi:DNA polymerase IV